MSNYTGAIPDTVPRRDDWMERAACRHDPEKFFDPAREDEAKRACFACPVLRDCQSWVMDAERGFGLYHRDGIVAALTAEERCALDPTAPKPPPDEDKPKPRPRAAQKHGTRACYKAGCRREECKAAAREYNQELKRRKELGEQSAKPEPKRAACPSVAAYRRHVRNGEPIDDGCRQAYVRHRVVQRHDERDRRVSRLWVKGLSDPEIAEQLGASIRAVRNARTRLGLMPNLHVRKAAS